jgi:membrane protease YdiL (CAAX protease family)
LNEPIQHYPGAMSAVLITLGGWFAWALVITFFGRSPDIAAIGVGQALGLGLVATLAARNVPAPQEVRLGLCGFESRFIPFLVLLLPVIVLTWELDSFLRGFLPEATVLAEAAAQDLDPNAALETLQSAIVIVGIAPVIEEFLFRGVLLQGTVATLGRVRGVLLTAVLYSIANVSPMSADSSPAAFLLSLLALGVIYGLARLATGSLLAPILLHVAVNGMGFWAAHSSDQAPLEGFDTSTSIPFSVVLAALIAVVIGLRGLWLAAVERPATAPLPADKGAAWRQDEDE